MDAKLTPQAMNCRVKPGNDGVEPTVVGSANLKPLGRLGRDVAKDWCEGRSVPLLVRTLLDHGRVTGRTVVENLPWRKRNWDQSVVRPADQPLSATRGIVGLKGNLAPAAAVVRVAGMADLKLTGQARFDGEEARCGTVKTKKYREGEVLVIRYAGPQGGPGMRDILAHGVVTERACHARI
jgi:dihydroxy-acid dehydratase